MRIVYRFTFVYIVIGLKTVRLENIIYDQSACFCYNTRRIRDLVILFSHTSRRN